MSTAAAVGVTMALFTSPAMAVSSSCTVGPFQTSCTTGTVYANQYGQFIDWQITSYSSDTIQYKVVDNQNGNVVLSGSSTGGAGKSGTITGLVSPEGYKMIVSKGVLGNGGRGYIDNV